MFSQADMRSVNDDHVHLLLCPCCAPESQHRARPEGQGTCTCRRFAGIAWVPLAWMVRARWDDPLYRMR